MSNVTVNSEHSSNHPEPASRVATWLARVAFGVLLAATVLLYRQTRLLNQYITEGRAAKVVLAEGTRIPSLRGVKLGSDFTALGSGRYLAILFSGRCSYCLNSMSSLLEVEKRSVGTRWSVVWLIRESLSSAPEIPRLAEISSPVLFDVPHNLYSALRFDFVPRVVAIDQEKVVKVWDGEVNQGRADEIALFLAAR